MKKRGGEIHLDVLDSTSVPDCVRSFHLFLVFVVVFPLNDAMEV